MDLGAACVKQASRFRLKPVLQYVRWLDCGTEGNHGFGSCVREEWEAFVGERRGTSACERDDGRAVWRRWAKKRPGRQTRPTYGAERCAVPLFGGAGGAGSAAACERAGGRAVWRRWRWAVKRPGRQTRPTYGRSAVPCLCLEVPEVPEVPVALRRANALVVGRFGGGGGGR